MTPSNETQPDYFVPFYDGSTKPSRDRWKWGDMKIGASSGSQSQSYWWDGLNMALCRPATSQTAESTGVYVEFGNAPLPLTSKLLLRLEFERPWARSDCLPVPANPRAIRPHPGKSDRRTSVVAIQEPWAVALNVKSGTANEVAGEPGVGTSCQFNSTGIRNNVPGAVESAMFKMIPNVVTPLDYQAWSPLGGVPASFSLELYFDGETGASSSLSSGTASLTVGKADVKRVFTHSGMYQGGSAHPISAIGASIATVTGVGQIMARLLSFAVWVA